MNFLYNIERLKSELNPIFIKLMKKIQLPAISDKHYSGKVDITEILKPFTHITIDERYKIIAYSSNEIHGVFGHAVAIPKNIEAPNVYLEHENCLFQKIIPDICYPVNEIIFCDGTPEGFFEVIVLNNVIWQLFKGYAKAYLDNYIFSLNDLSKKLMFMPTDLTPKYYKDSNGTTKLLLLEKNFDNGIDLCEYLFSNKFIKLLQKDKEFSHIDFEKKRFSDKKCCCCFSRKSICISLGE